MRSMPWLMRSRTASVYLRLSIWRSPPSRLQRFEDSESGPHRSAGLRVRFVNNVSLQHRLPHAAASEHLPAKAGLQARHLTAHPHGSNLCAGECKQHLGAMPVQHLLL
jgi:hypothetical protein